MRLAVVNQMASPGGWRVLKQLLLSFSNNIKGIDITVFIDIENFSIIHDIIENLKATGIKFEQINVKKKKKHKEFNYTNISKHLNNYDMVLFFWPYGITFPQGLKVPSCFVIHDLTLLYRFGFLGYNDVNLKNQLQSFMQNSTPVVLSNYGKKDVLEYFNNDKTVHVIPWSAFSQDKKISKDTQDKILNKYGLKPKEYVFYPTNNLPHKNNQLCIGIADLLQNKGTNIKVVLCGYGSESVTGHIEYTHIQSSQKNNILGLGIISDEELYVLIKNALCLFTTTLGEGGCGPASDAWVMGCPTIIADIPVLKEYANRFGVKSEFASPYNATEFVDKMLIIQKNPAKYTRICAENQKQMSKNWTWKHVAQAYAELFQKKKHLKIAFDFSFDCFVSAAEDIVVYNSFLFQALLENYPDVEIEIYTNEINIPELQKSMQFYWDKFKNRIHIITPTVAQGKKWYRINLYKYVFCALKQSFYKLLYKLTRNTHYSKRISKWRNKKHALRAVKYPLAELIKQSDADVAFLDSVLLTAAHNFRGPKVFMLHDLFTIPLADLFRDLLTNIDEINQNAVDNLNKYATEGTYFVTATPYIRDEQVFKYLSNVHDCQVINYPPMLRDYSQIELIPENDIRKKFGIMGPYTFYASQNRPNKNVLLLLKTLKRLKDKNVDFTLVTTGRMDTLTSTAEYVKKHNLQDRIVETGSLSEQELYTLYKYSAIAVVSTIVEGLGIPQQVLEPLIIGNIPVVCSKCWGVESSLNIFGLNPKKVDLNWVDLDDDKTLAEKIQEVLKNPQSHIEKQKHIIEAYTKRTWSDVAKDYMDLFNQIVKK